MHIVNYQKILKNLIDEHYSKQTISLKNCVKIVVKNRPM